MGLESGAAARTGFQSQAEAFMNRKNPAEDSVGRAGSIGPRLHRTVALAATLALVLVPMARAQRTPMKAGWNMFSAQQDVEVGQQVARDAERQLPLLYDSRVDDYLNTVGRRLAAHAPGQRFPYTYKLVNDRTINAFALPGGPVYINRGVIEAADNEAQLAGVMAHETSHVALRHGTNQASKAYIAQVPLAILGGVMGRNSAGAMLAQLGAGFAANSLLLKYSRNAESQADILGAQMLYDSGYDPRAMVQFFEIIQARSPGGRTAEFFSNHPNPDNRAGRVNQEVQKLGGGSRNLTHDSQEFQDIKRYLQSLPAPSPRGSAQRLQGGTGARGQAGSQPEWPSGRSQSFENSALRIQHPDNWQVYGQGDAAIAITPNRGLVDDGRGNPTMVYGVLVNLYESQPDSYGQPSQSEDYGTSQGDAQQRRLLEQSTERLLEELRHSNPGMRILRRQDEIRVDGQRAISIYLSSDSPLGGRETDWLVTVQRPQGLLFFVFVAPDRDFQSFDDTFQSMLESVRLH